MILFYKVVHDLIVRWIITVWHTNKTKLQANVLGRTPVFFTDTSDTARLTDPCLSARCPSTRFCSNVYPTQNGEHT